MNTILMRIEQVCFAIGFKKNNNLRMDAERKISEADKDRKKRPVTFL